MNKRANGECEITAYQNSLEYFKDYLALLSLQLHREVILTRAMRGDERQESFLGLFISEQDISAILSELHGSMLNDFPQGEKLLARIANQEAYIQKRLSLTSEPLSWQKLQKIFGLNDYEISMLLMALAPEIDNRFAKVYAYLHDDVARKNLSGFLSEKLCKSTDISAEKTRCALHADAPLSQYCLVQLQDNNQMQLLNRGLNLPSRVTHYLLEIQNIDDSLVDVLKVPWTGSPSLNTDQFTQSVEDTYLSWQQRYVPIILQHDVAADIDVWLSLFCEKTNVTSLSIDWHYLASLPLEKAQQLLSVFIREGHLTNSLLHVLNVTEQPSALLQTLFTMATPLLCLSTQESLTIEQYSVALLKVKVPAMSQHNYVNCWQEELACYSSLATPLPRHLIEQLATSYPVTMRTLRGICLSLPEGNTEGSTENNSDEEFYDALSQACREQVSQKMSAVAQGIPTHFTFNDLVLSPANIQALQDIIASQRNSHKVMVDWGVADVFFQSNASAVLFVGSSGTGKTMAANVLANELGLALFRIDLAGVVSKYIGETEKNLDKIFSVAAVSKVVLFIDEADALFGKRTEVKDAHDRYANIEVSYLLQKMEQHSGLVILASNLRQNIDDAFSRRFSSIVEFSLPKEKERLRLWQKLERTRAPLDENIDLAFLAQRFEISGGLIRNCILQAAYQAASQNEAINMQMLIRALSKEYTTLGRPISKHSFGDYYAVIRKEAAEAG